MRESDLSNPEIRNPKEIQNPNKTATFSDFDTRIWAAVDFRSRIEVTAVVVQATGDWPWINEWDVFFLVKR